MPAGLPPSARARCASGARRPKAATPAGQASRINARGLQAVWERARRVGPLSGACAERRKLPSPRDFRLAIDSSSVFCSAKAGLLNEERRRPQSWPKGLKILQCATRASRKMGFSGAAPIRIFICGRPERGLRDGPENDPLVAIAAMAPFAALCEKLKAGLIAGGFARWTGAQERGEPRALGRSADLQSAV